MLVNWEDEAVLAFQEAMPMAFQKLMRGIGVASSQFISIKAVFSGCVSGSEKFPFDRKVQYQKGTRKSEQSFLLTLLQSAEFHLGFMFISALLPVSDICFFRYVLLL